MAHDEHDAPAGPDDRRDESPRTAVDDVPELQVEVRVDAPPEEVFDYVTDPARFPGVEPRVVRLGEVIEREAPRRVRWHATSGGSRDDERDAIVEVTLAPDRGGTVVRISQWSPPAAFARLATRLSGARDACHRPRPTCRATAGPNLLAAPAGHARVR